MGLQHTYSVEVLLGSQHHVFDVEVFTLIYELSSMQGSLKISLQSAHAAKVPAE